jgi:hypothetical protein
VAGVQQAVELPSAPTRYDVDTDVEGRRGSAQRRERDRIEMAALDQ